VKGVSPVIIFKSSAAARSAARTAAESGLSGQASTRKPPKVSPLSQSSRPAARASVTESSGGSTL
jgi:hypothetical protein